MKDIVTKVDKQRYYNALKAIFSDGQVLTAREASIELHNRFDLGDATRGASHPRILELIDKGYLCRVERKKYDAYTKKMVTAYQRAGDDV